MSGLTTWTKALAALLAASCAFAGQAAPGNGIRLGGSDAHVHPFLDLESRYDSNVWYTPANQSVGDVILHVRPGLEVKAPGDLATFEFSGALDWAQYLKVERYEGNLSRWYASASIAAAFNRSGAVSPRLDNTFSRQVSSTSLTAAAAAVVSNQNTLSLSVPWKPGGGALVLAANGQWLVESYEKYADAPGASLAGYGYSQYRGGAELQWHFLPRTSGLLQGGYYARVPNKANQASDATGYDVMAGVTGLMTPRISATAKVGVGSETAADAKDALGNVTIVGATTTSLLGDVSAEWLPLESLSFRLGYARTLGLDPTVSIYTADGVSGGVRVRVAERFTFHAGARWDHLAFTSISAGGATTDFLRVDPGLDVQLGRWLTAGLGYVYSSRSATVPGGVVPNYSKSEVFLKVGLTY